MDEYEQQAQAFLEKTGTKLTVSFVYTGPISWGDKDDQIDYYRVLIERGGKVLDFEYGDSIHNSLMRKVANTQASVLNDAKLSRKLQQMNPQVWMQIQNGSLARARAEFYKQWRNYKPNAYDVLAGLSLYEGSFDDFCSEFGYDERPMAEYPKVMEIYSEVTRISSGLRRMYSEAELQELQEIN